MGSGKFGNYTRPVRLSGRVAAFSIGVGLVAILAALAVPFASASHPRPTPLPLTSDQVKGLSDCHDDETFEFNLPDAQRVETDGSKDRFVSGQDNGWTEGEVGQVSIWANATSYPLITTLEIGGSENVFDGLVRSRANLKIGGQFQLLRHGTQYGNNSGPGNPPPAAFLLSGGDSCFSPEPTKEPMDSPPQPQGFPFDFDPDNNGIFHEHYAPGSPAANAAHALGQYFACPHVPGLSSPVPPPVTCDASSGKISGDISGSAMDTGLYYATGEVDLSGQSIAANVTIVTRGDAKMKVDGSNQSRFTPYDPSKLLFMTDRGTVNTTNGDGSDSLLIAGSVSEFEGMIHAPKGMVTLDGSQNTYTCPIMGDRVLVSGSLNYFETGCNPSQPGNPVLGITKTPDGGSVAIGDPAQFTITVTNSGSLAATNVDIDDTLPGTGLTWTVTSAQKNGVDLVLPDECEITGGNTLHCDVANLPAGQSIVVIVESSDTTEDNQCEPHGDNGVIDNGTDQAGAEGDALADADGVNQVNDPGLINVACPSPPTIQVTKDVTPSSRPEPGGNFTYTVTVTNTSAEPLEITSLEDDVYGTLAGDADCQVGTTLAASGGSCTFSFTEPFTGTAGDDETDTVEACAEDADQNEACDTDPATIILTDVLPDIAVTKDVTPASLPEPGGDFTYTVTVTNNTAEAVTITSLNDDVYGVLAGDADCQVGTVLAASGGSCTFDFVGTFNGDAGDSETDTVTVCAADDDENSDCATDTATVTLTDVLPVIEVTKDVTPASLPEPGGDFTYTVTVTNNTAEAVTITSLNDDVYGVLAGDADCQVGTVLAASGGSCTFDFVGTFTGNAGDSEIDTVTACAADDDLNSDCDTDTATVTITDVLPVIEVTKDVTPSSLPEPGGDFTYTVTVTNNSTEAVTITSLEDDVYGVLAGDADCQVGTVLAANGGTCAFNFVGTFNGDAGDSETDTVEVCAEDNDQQSDCDTDHETVTLTDVEPVVAVTKDVTPSSLPEPGGNFTYTVTVTNNSVEAVTITSLDDDVYGALAGDADCQVGTVLAANGGTCSFTFVGAFFGDAGDSETDTVEACVADNDENSDCDTDQETVTITDVLPVINVVKDANPSSLPAPGGNFTFDVTVTNNSTEAVTITSLEDDIHGVLAGDSNCEVGTVLAANGGSCSFSFVGNFTGNAGDSETDTVEACAVDNDENQDCDTDPATVTITPVVTGQGSISVTKSADPTTLQEPGGPVQFSVRITNTSSVNVTIANVVDNVFGDLDDSGGNGCFDVPINMPPGTFVTCQFTAPVTGPPGSTHVDVVTASGSDEFGNPVSASDDARVVITPRLIDLVIVKNATSPTPLNGIVNYTMTVTNKGPDTATNVQLADPAPSAITYLTASPSQGTCNVTASLITCSLGTIAPNQTVTITVTGRATQVGTHTNVATVTGGGGRETNPADNVDDAVTVVPAPQRPPTRPPVVQPEPCLTLTVSPKMIKADGKPDRVRVLVTAGQQRVRGTKITIFGAGVRKTGRSNGQGIAFIRINPKKAGLITITALETNRRVCGPKRIGVVGVFLPPLTG